MFMLVKKKQILHTADRPNDRLTGNESYDKHSGGVILLTNLIVNKQVTDLMIDILTAIIVYRLVTCLMIYILVTDLMMFFC